MEKKIKELTRAEEQVMQILWKQGKGYVKDLVNHFPEPKPAYNTVSTIIRILEKKGVVAHKSYGNTHEYYPLLTREAYSKRYLGSFVNRFFGNSYHNLVSFFAEHEQVSLQELEEIRHIVEKEISKKRKK
ncbi:MAG: BlaI/MecI/CopY family transcriptional regulator [Bacteroidales bacterium]